MFRWRLYYEDGSTYGDEDGEPWHAPKSGAQAVVVHDPAVGYVTLKGSDFYCYDPAWDCPVWRNMDVWGMQEYMREPGPRCVVFGEWMGNHEYQALCTRVTQELGDRQRYPHDVD